ncbi:MAG TPA: tyrosine-type recombinase/integrase [Acidimicrobiales bacterium]|nr:tyrosine-type recombinase/integrase [Acidimicrobiales bacterium]
MTPLQQAASDYLRLRRSVGYKLPDADRCLCDLVASVESRGETTITTAAALAWAEAGSTAGVVSRRVGIARAFAKYLTAVDPATEVPPEGIVPPRLRRRPPYLFSETQVAALMGAAGSLRPPLRAATCETVIGLLWATGVRIGEVCRLEVGDVDIEGRTLSVWFTKFGKSRLVPVTDSVADALAGYAERRQTLCPRPRCTRFFVTSTGNPLTPNTFRAAFSRLLADVGLPSTPVGHPPRVHDVRHSFAVDTLIGWYRAGEDVQALLPRLSTYMGHVGPQATFWYLSAAPELMALAADRLEHGRGVNP